MKPKLRFQGFHDDWEEKKLGEVAEYRTSKIDFDSQNSNYVSTENLIKDFGGAFFPNYTNELRVNGYIKNDILMGNIRPYLKKLWKSDRSGGASNDVNIIYSKGRVNPDFLYYLLANSTFINYVMLTATGTKMPRGNKKMIMQYNTSLPSLPEQEKIGAFLSQLDDRIEKQEQKIALLKERKKGWMQQLFSQTIRFKDENGQDYPAWEEKKFLSLFDLIIDYRGKTPKKLGFDWGGNIPALSALNVKDGYIDWQADIHFGSSELCDIWMKEPLAYNDILFTMEAPLGNVALVPDNKSYILSQRVIALRTKQNYPVFIFQMMRSNSFQSIISKLSTGTTAKGINQKGLNKISVLVPSLPEQEKIAEFLSKQDELIEKEEEKLSLFKAQKKGLLQQMFV